MLGETEIIINGFYFEKVEGIRTLKSVFVLDTDNNKSIEIPVLNDANIDREELTKELLEHYREKVTAIIDIKNAVIKPYRNFDGLGFVGIKKNNLF